jgi:hypothetical protein
MRFRAIVQLNGKTATGIEVPPEIVADLGSGKKPAVSVTINGYTYRSTVATMGGKFMLPVSAEIRTQAHVNAGDEVDVDLELDTAPREVELPADFVAALSANAAAQQFFDSLSYSNKRRITLPIDDAKTPETRQRRIDAAIAKLGEERL